MKFMTLIIRPLLILSMGFCLSLSPGFALASASGAPLPDLLQAGFASWTKGGSVDVILSGWQKGGLMEGSSKAAEQARYIKNVMRLAGNYRGHEVLRAKDIGRGSQVVYLAINFEHGAVYARFLFYRAEQDWVVQNMDFSVKPEAVMPWLAMEGDGNAQ